MHPGLKNLTRLINFPVLLRIIGWLLMIEGAFMLVPLVVALCFNEEDWNAFGIASALAFFFGYVLTKYLRPASHRIGKREGFMLTGLVWVVFSLFGMIPFLLSVTPLSVSESFFEAMSGFTTTGACISGTHVVFSHALQIWRALMQWIGGMGIILFTLAIIPMLNYSGGVQMFNSEVTGITHDKLRPRISQTAKSLWMLYIILTACTFALLWLGPMDWFDAICHSFGTVSTGGYSTSEFGILKWNSPYVLSVITVFMFLGGTNFILIFKLASGNRKALKNNEIFKAYLSTILVAFVLFVAAIAIQESYSDWQDLSIKPLFQIVSTITSTGYTIAHFQSWGFFVMTLIFLMMLMGGCAGSTSGGIKVDRMVVLAKFCRNELYKCVHPNSITTVKIGGKVMPHEIVSKVIAFICIFFLLIIFGALALTALGLEVSQSIVTAISCCTNIGMGIGEAADGSIWEIPSAARWVMSALMLIGRLEVFTILVLFTPAFWKR